MECTIRGPPDTIMQEKGIYCGKGIITEIIKENCHGNISQKTRQRSVALVPLLFKLSHRK